ncbi:hypothetical protein JCM8547_007500 [Rhodosporidiobolus lusitaniae]
MRFPVAVGLAALLRVILLLWGTYQDAHGPVPYTDVDYFVFSDAATCLVRPSAPNCLPAQGAWATSSVGDPYARSTYRYTPLLALLLVPNTVLHPAFGKVLFSLCDLLVGVLLYNLCLRRDVRPARAANSVAALWLLNPIIANISTRGSSESVIGAAVVSTLSLAEAGRWDAAALVYGLAVHLKIFPVIYGSSLAAALLHQHGWSRFFYKAVRFGVISFVSFAALTGGLYLFWGAPFLNETFLYHLRRLDHRHNFSPYFLPFYLSETASLTALTALQAFARHPLAAFIPQLGLCVVLGGLLGGRDLSYASLVQTFAFVSLNKVCTSQYFLWFLWLLPPALSRIRMSTRRAMVVAGVWVGGQALWLSQAYQLEIVGESVFRKVWLAGLVFATAQGWVLSEILSSFS